MNGSEKVTTESAKQKLAAVSISAYRLSNAQEKQLLRLVSVLGRATEAQRAAQQALDLANGNANDFIVYCAEEIGLVLGEEWLFDQPRMSFVRQEQEATY